VAADSLLPGAGAGLVGLRERVSLSGGSISAGPTAEGGWRVEAWLPWSEKDPAKLGRTDDTDEGEG
jgi:glucose-6-phosphate-specific signal transduction histidine kinase